MEADLVAQAQSGNVTAVGQLYDQYQPEIFRFIISRVHDQQLAEDLTGELFTRMVTHLAAYRQQELPFRAWLYRIGRNLMVDHFRRQSIRNHVPLEQVRVEANSSPSLVLEQKLTMTQVQQALTRLDPAQREVVELRFIVGLPLKEVAYTLDKSVAAVKSLQHRGLKALRVALEVADVAR